MVSKTRIEDALKRVGFTGKIGLGILIALGIFIVLVVLFLVLWSTIGFKFPIFFTGSKETCAAPGNPDGLPVCARVDSNASNLLLRLFLLWTAGTVLFGVVLTAFTFHREFRNANDTIGGALKKVGSIGKITLAVFIVAVVLFLTLWSTIGFKFPIYLVMPGGTCKHADSPNWVCWYSDPKGPWLYVLWTMGTVLFGVVLTVFTVRMSLRD